MTTGDRKLPIEKLITERMIILGLTPYRLALMCGYKNGNKGQKRLRDLYCGSIDEAKQIIAGLPTALEVSEDVVSQAVEETRRTIDARAAAARAKEDAEWRENFVPHAIVLAEKRVPEPMFVAACFGLRRLLLIEFDLGLGEETFPSQARVGVAAKLHQFGRDGVAACGLPAFGRPLGFIVNYTPDRATHYNLNLEIIEERACCYRLGELELRVRSTEPS